MGNLNYRLKKLENHTALSKDGQKKHVIFWRWSPDDVSEQERQFFEGMPDRENYKILTVICHDPDAEKFYRKKGLFYFSDFVYIIWTILTIRILT